LSYCATGCTDLNLKAPIGYENGPL
jgi:hypothetical protein